MKKITPLTALLLAAPLWLLPVGIAAKMILTGNLKEKGVTLPIKAEVYEPILYELKAYGIEFTESGKVIKLI